MSQFHKFPTKVPWLKSVLNACRFRHVTIEEDGTVPLLHHPFIIFHEVKALWSITYCPIDLLVETSRVIPRVNQVVASIRFALIPP